jgi:hypothetical protein
MSFYANFVLAYEGCREGSTSACSGSFARASLSSFWDNPRSGGGCNEIANRFCGSCRLCGGCCLRAESVVVVSSGQQYAKLAESRNRRCTREVQESAAALLDSRCRPVGERERGASGSGPSCYGRNSRRAGGRAVMEGRLVMGKAITSTAPSLVTVARYERSSLRRTPVRRFAISHRRSAICGHPFAIIASNIAKRCLQIGDRVLLIADVLPMIRHVC